MDRADRMALMQKPSPLTLRLTAKDIRAVADTLEGTDKTFVMTSGLAVYLD